MLAQGAQVESFGPPEFVGFWITSSADLTNSCEWRKRKHERGDPVVSLLHWVSLSVFLSRVEISAFCSVTGETLRISVNRLNLRKTGLVIVFCDENDLLKLSLVWTQQKRCPLVPFGGASSLVDSFSTRCQPGSWQQPGEKRHELIACSRHGKGFAVDERGDGVSGHLINGCELAL